MAKWDQLCDVLDLRRLMLQRDVSASSSTTLERMLPIRERLALPGVFNRTRFAGREAVMERIGAASCKAKEFLIQDTGPLGPLLDGLRRAAKGELPEEDIVAVAEMLSFIALAVQRGSTWEGEFILYPKDNMDARGWLKKRKAKHPLFCLVLLIFQRLESKHGFIAEGIYVRTYRNQLNDGLTRTDQQEVESKLIAAGWKRIEPDVVWQEVHSRTLKITSSEPRGELEKAACWLTSLPTAQSGSQGHPKSGESARCVPFQKEVHATLTNRAYRGQEARWHGAPTYHIGWQRA